MVNHFGLFSWHKLNLLEVTGMGLRQAADRLAGLEALGIDLEQLKEMSVRKQWLTVVGALSLVREDACRLSLAVRILGKEGHYLWRQAGVIRKMYWDAV